MNKRIIKLLLDIIDQQEKTLGNNTNFFEGASLRDGEWASIVDDLKRDNAGLIESVESLRGEVIAPTFDDVVRLEPKNIEQHPIVLALRRRIGYLELTLTNEGVAFAPPLPLPCPPPQAPATHPPKVV